MDEPLKAGDVVQLKSGGPRMTVKEVNGSEVVCVWFAGEKRETAVFEDVLLTKAGFRI